MKTAHYLTGNVTKHLLSIAVPGMVGMVASISIHAVDTYFIAKLGKNQLIAISFVFPVFEIILAFALSFGITTLSLAARSLGQNKPEQAQETVSTALILASSFGVLMTLLGYLSNDTFFRLLGAPAEIIPLIRKFSYVWYLGFVTVFTNFVLAFTLRAHAHPRIASGLGLLSALINFALDPILIFGWGPIPKFGIAGAAWASIMARLVSFAIMLTIIHRKQLARLPNSVLAFKKESIKIFRTYVPTSLTQLILPFSMMVVTHLLAHINPDCVAGYGIASKVQFISVIPLLALSGALNPVVGQNYGGNAIERAEETFTKAIKMACGFSLLVAFGLFVLKRPITHLFSTHESVARVSLDYFNIVPISYLGWGILMCCVANFNAVGRPAITTLFSFVRAVVLLLPCAYFLGARWSYVGIFFAINIANMGSGLLSFCLTRRFYRKLLTT